MQDQNHQISGSFSPWNWLINSFKHHIGVVNFPKICTKSSSLQPNFFWLLADLFLSDLFFPCDEQQEFEFFSIQISHSMRMRIGDVLTALDPSKYLTT